MRPPTKSRPLLLVALSSLSIAATGYNSAGDIVAFQDVAPFPYCIYSCP